MSHSVLNSTATASSPKGYAPGLLTQDERLAGVVLLPVKPAVRKWLLARYGEVVHVSSKNHVGQLMLALDIDLPELPNPRDVSTEGLVPMKFRFAVRDVWRAYQRSQEAVWGGHFCWTIFSLEMVTWVDASRHAGRQALASLEEWLASYGITEEDYPLESAYRYYKKFRPERAD